MFFSECNPQIFFHRWYLGFKTCSLYFGFLRKKNMQMTPPDTPWNVKNKIFSKSPRTQKIGESKIFKLYILDIIYEKKFGGYFLKKKTFFHFWRTFGAKLKIFLGGAQYIPKCLPKTMIKKILSAWVCILEFFFTFFWQVLSNFWRHFFLPFFWWNQINFCLNFPKWCNTLYFCWKN